MRGALLDTMTVLRAGYRPDLLSRRASQRLLDLDVGPLFYSVVSLWEIGLKRTRGSHSDLRIPSDWDTALVEGLHEQGIDCIGIEPRHCKLIETLPLHHRDPFDRMIFTQALAKDLELISSDRMAEVYGLTVIW